VRVTADCFNQEGEHATLEKFEEVVTWLLKEFGITNAIAFFESIPPEQDTKVDFNTYTIEFKREKYNIGYGWTFTLTTKWGEVEPARGHALGEPPALRCKWQALFPANHWHVWPQRLACNESIAENKN